MQLSNGLTETSVQVDNEVSGCDSQGEEHTLVISVAYAGKGQHQDAGAKVHHLAPNTTSNILSKSISKNGGRSYRGMLQVTPKATDAAPR